MIDLFRQHMVNEQATKRDDQATKMAESEERQATKLRPSWPSWRRDEKRENGPRKPAGGQRAGLRSDRADREHARECEQLSRERWQESYLGTMREQQKTAQEKARRPLRMGVDFPTLSKLDDPANIQLFLDCFRREVCRYNIPEDQQTPLLLPLLDAKSADLARRLPVEDQQSLPILTKKLLLLHGITIDHHRREWYDLQRRPKEDIATRVSFSWTSEWRK